MSIEDYEKENQKLLYEKENQKLLYEKEKENQRLQYENLEKEKENQRLLNEKEKEKEKLHYEKEKEIEINDLKSKLQAEKVRNLQAQGLMTSRGVFERFLYDAYSSDFPNQKKIHVADTYRHIMNEWNKLEKNPEEKCSEKVLKIIQIFKDCGLTSKDVKLMYDNLSVSTHGFPWSGDSVRVFTSSMSNPNYACVIKKICAEMHLEAEEVTEINKN